MTDQDRDALRKCVLELLKKGAAHFTDIEKKAIATCKPFITSNTFKTQFYDYLFANGYISRVSRGVFTITSKGERLLELLSSV